MRRNDQTCWNPLGLALWLSVWFVSAAVARADSEPASEQAFSSEAVEFFETKIRPVLSENCLECHGESKQTSKLRLDSRTAILEGGALEGPAVDFEEPEFSPLILAVRHELTTPMPPKPQAPLSEQVITDLEQWVRMGLPWPSDEVLSEPEQASAALNHWAFQPIANPTPPNVQEQSWVANPIDAFILEQQEAKGLTPSPRADRRTLIRRATFDLTGLPPASAEVDDFVNDPKPDAEAFARVVDRLLASPAYGERWARHWLDVARYADTKGYVFQEERRYPYAYTYRDYVVRAFNEDKPFHQFVKEQVAADQLDLADDRDLAAMGYLTVGRRFLNNQHDIIDDRIDVVTRGVLGLTVACARCHDHKYDPIPTADYYSLYGVFASSFEPDDPPAISESAEPGPEREDYERQLAERQQAVNDYLDELAGEFQAHLDEHLKTYLLAAFDLEFQGNHGKLDDIARAHELEPRRLRSFVARFARYLEQTEANDDPIFAPWHALAALASESFAEQAVEVVATLDESMASPIVLEALTTANPMRFQEVIECYADLFTSVRSCNEVEGEPDLATLQSLLADTDGPFVVPKDQTARLVNRAERNRLQELQRNAAQLSVSHPGAPPRAMVMLDKDELVDPYVFLRGTPGNRGEPVPRRFLKLLEGDERESYENSSGRRELAEALVREDNPLTSRVLVNRVWMHLFGSALVGTPSDFGLRSEPPTHPELLDWLATWFQAEGWSVKSLHRLILLSNSYAQQSLDRPEYASIDPENALLWRQNRRRLEFEAMRDAMLAASGRLDPTFGGRPGPSPAEPGNVRRTLYSFIDRQNLEGVYRTFDFASPDASTPLRYKTTVPQQALFLMNSPFVAQQAKDLARRVSEQVESADPAALVNPIHQWLFSRSAEPREVELASRFLDVHDESPAPEPPPWQYGYGGVDEAAGRVAAFQAFPHWTGEAWQFGAEYPHPEGSYMQLKADSGHVGPDQDRAVIRRWVAPFDAVITINGMLRHQNDKGDGVRGRIVAEHGGILGEWIAHDSRARTTVERYEVQAGETIDFVTDCRAEHSFDAFHWAPRVRVVEAGSEGSLATFDAKGEFQGPAPEPLTALERYAQVLLLTNEFLFVD